MFLNRLSLKEKEAFLRLAHHVAHADNQVSKEEDLVITKYCMEMQMDDVSYDVTSFDLGETLNCFESDGNRKIALLEIMALIYADNILSVEEQSLIDQMIEHFELNPNLAIVYREWAKSILSLFVQGEALIHL
ncbi:TerB family tellurite resistance protein [Vibrio sp. Vb1018]|uniref:TerB family tellurite resistance protein n=1 Tax=Vibrio sp. Vb1018 TaxID=3074636 RepID=UPI002964CCF2|nr:TerB family tellurite resistance protein [Vibrio sp. Vb1018]MDW1821581.1 TerB family tellurite resistance protein [Vibrio sp. Vb1018]